jgi:hypothetical protein
MAACPNCGRRTLRTKDWVCQWCGYPLLGGGYKPIDKTYRELQEERNSSFRPEEQEPEPEYKYEPEPEPDPEPKPEPKWKLNKAPKPSYQKKTQPAPEPESEYPPEDLAPEPELGPSPRPVYRPAPRPVEPLRTQPAPRPTPEIAPQPQPGILPRSRPEPVLLPRAETAPQPEPPLVVPPRAEPPLQSVAPLRPEPPPAPQPEALTLPSLDSITNGTQLSIDQIDAMFRADNVGTNLALKDKVIVIKGIINKVFIRDHLDIRYLVLTGARKVVWSARCTFDKEASSSMSRLAEGQAVALRGKYDGYGKNIIFKECTLLASN